jgi:hypothetical protein
LLYPGVNVDYAVGWIRANCPTFMLRFYDFLVQQTGTNTPHMALVQDALMEFCTTLIAMERDPNFDLKLITYSDDALDAPPARYPAMRADIAHECANKISRIVRCFGDSMMHDGTSLERFVREIEETQEHRWLLFEVLSIGRMYEEAIHRILETNDLLELQEFCRNAPDCRAAFSVAFTQLRAQRDILENGAEFLIRNLEWLDPVDMLDWLPENQPLASVSHILIAAQSYLVNKARIMQMKLSVGKSMALDVDYRLVKAQLRNGEVQHSTVCHGCNRPLGSGWLAVSPDNRLYHMTCRPKLAPR